MRRGLLPLLTVLIALAIAPVATANKPTREVNPVQDDMVIAGQCAFPVLAHIDGGGFTGQAGAFVQQGRPVPIQQAAQQLRLRVQQRSLMPLYRGSRPQVDHAMQRIGQAV